LNQRFFSIKGSPLDFVEVKIVDPQSGNITKIGETGTQIYDIYD
jgi:hypothetical protein